MVDVLPADHSFHTGRGRQQTGDGKRQQHLVGKLIEVKRRHLGLPDAVLQEVVEAVREVDDLEQERHAEHADQEDLQELADHVAVEDPHPPALLAWKKPAIPTSPNRMFGLHMASAGDRNWRSASFSPPMRAT